jgi:MoaA/NifB/PqqE/SkfB family radical SAM enzyme
VSRAGAGPRGAPPAGAFALGLRLARQLRDFLLRRHPPAAPPYRLWVDLTSRCNLACPACPQRLLGDSQRRDMDEGLLEELARQAGAWGCQVSLFHRGEPLLHPRFDHWIARFRRAGATVRLHTNATLLDEERARRLLAAPPDLLTISLDTLDPADYALARPGAELGRTLANLEGLLRLRGQGGGGPPRISLLLMGRQRGGEEARARLERLKALGLERVVWRAPHNWGGTVPGAKQGGAAPRQPAVCTFPWYGLAVLSDGRVTPCPQDFLGEMSLGEMAPGQSLGEIWRGEAYGELRRDLAARRLDQRPVCQVCDRIRRPTLLGLPTEHLKNILTESIVEPRGGGKGSFRRRSD